MEELFQTTGIEAIQVPQTLHLFKYPLCFAYFEVVYLKFAFVSPQKMLKLTLNKVSGQSNVE